MRYLGLWSLSVCFFAIICIGCRTQSSHLKITSHVVFPDSLDAVTYLLTDAQEGFFEHITAIDMAVQLKDTLPLDRKRLLAAYRQQQAKEVVQLNEAQKKRILGPLQIAIQAFQESIQKPFPLDSLFIIVVKGDLYGGSVYFTRGKAIIIPLPELESAKFPISAQKVLSHEIFHCLSRNFPSVKAALYPLVGFEHLAKAPEFESKVLQDKILSNPDGLSATKMKVHFQDSSVWAMPILVSKYQIYSHLHKDFFTYIDFGLYPLREIQGRYIVQGDRQLDKEWMNDFYRQIGDNTQYIIHPDEILADNYVLAVYSSLQLKTPSAVRSAEGQILVDRLTAKMKTLW